MIRQIDGRSVTILIVDDDQQVSKLISQILKEEFILKSYQNAEEALQSADMSEIDIIIADVKLPGMNGIDFLKNIQSLDPEIPVIMITGFSDIDVAISALKCGAFDFIPKPFNNDQINASVNKAIERRKLILENRMLLNELKVKNEELEKLNRNIRSRNLEIEHELDIAGNLQKCLFPVTLPEIDGFDFFMKFQPVEKISGDFFDFICINDTDFYFIFADVSGHGVPAALYSAMVKTAMSTVVSDGMSPSDFISAVNKYLIAAQKKMSYNYATMFCGLFNNRSGNISYCNAGIPAPVIIRRSGGMDLLEPNNPFIGIFESSRYKNSVVNIEQGDKLIFFTDGVFECVNRDDRVMGQKIFVELVQKYREIDTKDIIEKLFSDALNFCGDYKYSDDLTLLGMHYRGVK